MKKEDHKITFIFNSEAYQLKSTSEAISHFSASSTFLLFCSASCAFHLATECRKNLVYDLNIFEKQPSISIRFKSYQPKTNSVYLLKGRKNGATKREKL